MPKFNKKNVVKYTALYRGRGLPMSKRIINGRWYSNIYDPENPNKKIVVSLNSYAWEKRKSDIALGAIQRDLENGIRPISARTTIKKLKLPYEPKERPKKNIKKSYLSFFLANTNQKKSMRH